MRQRAPLAILPNLRELSGQHARLRGLTKGTTATDMGLFSRKTKDYSSYAIESSRQEAKLKQKLKECFEQMNFLGWLLLSEDDYKARLDDWYKRVRRLENEAEAAKDFTEVLGPNSSLSLIREIGKIRSELKNAGWQPPSQTRPHVFKSRIMED